MARDYEPLWERIKHDYIYARDNMLPYHGTTAYDIAPKLRDRVIKAVSNEKGWHAKDSWPESRYTKLKCTYNAVTYEMHFQLQPHRVVELQLKHLRKLI
jgi:hypothetical protein